MKIKICGITNAEDAKVAVEAGADALGFVLYRKSPRYVEPQVLKRIIATLPPFVIPVGVFVNEELGIVRKIMDDCGLELAQLHGDESASYCEKLERPIIKGIRLHKGTTQLQLAELKGRAQVRGFLLDAFSDKGYGGTGEIADWPLASEVAKVFDILLAGGLTAENVQGAIQQVCPYGVDVSSGVEASPGKKDPAKVQEFINSVRLVS